MVSGGGGGAPTNVLFIDLELGRIVLLIGGLWGLLYTYVLMTTIGTHDAQNLSVTSWVPGEIRVSGVIINGSSISGVLAIIYDGNEIVYYRLIKAEGRKLFRNITGIREGEYKVSMFDVEENGLPFERVASLPKTVFVGEGKTCMVLQQQTQVFDCTIIYR